MKKSYEQQQADLQEKSLELFHQAEHKHVRLLEIEEAAEALNPDEPDYGNEHFELTMDLAYIMRDQVDLSLQSAMLKMNTLDRANIPVTTKRDQKH